MLLSKGLSALFSWIHEALLCPEMGVDIKGGKYKPIFREACSGRLSTTLEGDANTYLLTRVLGCFDIGSCVLGEYQYWRERQVRGNAAEEEGG